jgi:hypothetical protein
MNDDDVKKMEDHYFAKARMGITLSVERLRAYAAKNKLGFNERQASSLRYRWKQTAKYSRYRRPPKYVGSSVDRLGNLMIDLGEFHKKLAHFNRGCKYFIVGVDCLSQKLSCIPVKVKDQAAWEYAVKEMKAKHYRLIKTIITDRDTAVAGKAFQNRIKRELGINWIHLKNRSKAYKAERMIAFMKQRLSMALELNKKGDKNWVQHIDSIVNDYNEQFIKGTNIRRRDASKKNYMQILEQKLKTKDPTPYFNLAVSGDFSPQLAAKLFKYRVGQRVLLAIRADYTADVIDKGAFYKPTVRGNFGKVYTISERLLKSNSDLFLSVVYRLQELDGLFYDSELKPALFAGDDDDINSGVNNNDDSVDKAEEEEEEEEESSSSGISSSRRRRRRRRIQ